MKTAKKITAIILCLISIISVIPFNSSAAALPEKPIGFSVESVTADSVKLSWLPSHGATGYRIYTYLDGKWKIVKDTTANEAVISGLNASKTYTFAIRSAVKYRNALYFCNGYSYLKVKTLNLDAAVLSAQAGVDYVNLSWGKVPGACGYAVYQYNGFSWQRLGTVSKKRTTATVKKLKSFTDYYFGIRPYTEGDGKVIYGDASNIVKIKTLDSNKVTLSCAAVNDSAVKLVWSKAESVSGYRVYLYVSDEWKAVKDIYGADNLGCIINGLTSDTKYYFRVRAFRINGKDVKWYTPSDICTAVTNPGVKDVYIHRVENLKSSFETDSYTFSYDNVTRRYGTIPVTIAKNENSFYLYTKVNEMPYIVLNQDEENSYIILDEIESYIKIPALLSNTFSVKSAMDDLFPGEDWSSKASIVTFNSQKVVCETFVNPQQTKMLKFYFKTDELIAIDEIGLSGIEGRAIIKSITPSSDPAFFSVPSGYDKLFFNSIEDIIIFQGVE